MSRTTMTIHVQHEARCWCLVSLVPRRSRGGGSSSPLLPTPGYKPSASLLYLIEQSPDRCINGVHGYGSGSNSTVVREDGRQPVRNVIRVDLSFNYIHHAEFLSFASYAETDHVRDDCWWTEDISRVYPAWSIPLPASLSVTEHCYVDVSQYIV